MSLEVLLSLVRSSLRVEPVDLVVGNIALKCASEVLRRICMFLPMLNG